MKRKLLITSALAVLIATPLAAQESAPADDAEARAQMEYQLMMEEAERTRQEAEAARRDAEKMAETARAAARRAEQLAREDAELQRAEATQQADFDGLWDDDPDDFIQ